MVLRAPPKIQPRMVCFQWRLVNKGIVRSGIGCWLMACGHRLYLSYFSSILPPSVEITEMASWSHPSVICSMIATRLLGVSNSSPIAHCVDWVVSCYFSWYTRILENGYVCIVYYRFTAQVHVLEYKYVPIYNLTLRVIWKVLPLQVVMLQQVLKIKFHCFIF